MKTVNKHLDYATFYEKCHRDELGNIHNLIVIMKYLENEGWDFSKKGRLAMPKSLRNKKIEKRYLIKGNGQSYYL
jgi:hypothetical protein